MGYEIRFGSIAYKGVLYSITEAEYKAQALMTLYLHGPSYDVSNGFEIDYICNPTNRSFHRKAPPAVVVIILDKRTWYMVIMTPSDTSF